LAFGLSQKNEHMKNFRALFQFILLSALLGAASSLALRAESPLFRTSPGASVMVIGGSMMNGDQFADSTLPSMREHFLKCRTIALVLHATLPADRDTMEKRLRAAFLHLGGQKAESLHQHDEKSARLLLQSADGIFVGGGETFVLLRELYLKGHLELIRERVLAGAPYAGSSAGANVAGLLIGTTNDFPTAEVPSRASLAVFPAVINPHHPDRRNRGDFDTRAAKIGNYLKHNPAETVVALGDAAMARLHGGKVTLVAGNGWIYRSKGSEELKVGEVIAGLVP